MTGDGLTDAGRHLRDVAANGNEVVRPWSYVPCAREHRPGRLCILKDGHHPTDYYVDLPPERARLLHMPRIDGSRLTAAEALYRAGPGPVENVECTPEEFRDWYLAIPPVRQVEVAGRLLDANRASLRCFIENHRGRIEALEAGYREAMSEQQPEQGDTTETTVETPAKDTTSVEVAATPETEGGNTEGNTEGATTE